MRKAAFILIAAATLVISACGSADSSAPQPPAPVSTAASVAATPAGTPAESPTASAVNVLATTTMLGDVVGQILACAGGTVTVLMPTGTDPHDFSASSDQVAAMVTANLVVANGLGLEAGLTDAFENAAADGAKVFEVGPLVNPIELGAGANEHGEEEAGQEHDSLDPHFWFDMNRMALAAELIGAELADSTGDGAYATCAATTAVNIRTAEAGVRSALDSVPADQRILVTDHEALGYLADTYGYEIAGTVIPSSSTLAEPSSGDLADLVATLKAEGVTAIFANVAQTTSLAEAVAAETGMPIKIIPLYVESLGAPDSPAATYIAMMQANADLIAGGLKG
ncbi:MAG: metal ABC transporter substrate-binding protein [Actinobacteria bacterium]|nr:MAG: metal ABC transporter substrate-binding protein [Actinomycetota bacterium]